MATIYDLRTGYVITEGLQGCDRSSEALNASRRIAADRNTTVLLDDDDGEWLVGPRGGIRRATAALKRRYGVA